MRATEETGSIVRFTLDPAKPPTMTPEQMAHWEAMTDDDIDYSDIPDRSSKKPLTARKAPDASDPVAFSPSTTKAR